MVKRSIILLMSLVALNAAIAQRMLDISSGTFSSYIEEPTVERTITQTDNGYRVTYEFQKAVLLPDDLFPNCETWHLNGFGMNNHPEQPAYPYGSDSFSIPFGCTAEVKVVNEEWLTVSSLASPARQALMLSDTIGYTIDNVRPITPVEDTWLPKVTITDNGIRTYKNIGIINIGVTPVQFNIDKEQARICKTLEYEVSFLPAESSLFRSPTEEQLPPYFADPYLSNTTLNWDLERQQSEVTPLADVPSSVITSVPNYLIIAPNLYKTAVEEFAEWKRTLGFNVTTAYKATWTEEDIVDEVIGQDNLEYLLLVGNNNQLPAYRMNYYPQGINTETITDSPFICFDEEIIPEISCGRLPVNNLNEAKLTLNKIINYEKTPSSDNNFYKSNLFLTAFLGKATSATMRNSQTTYEISKYMESLGKNVTRLFSAYSYQTPQQWSDPGYDENGILCIPCPIPGNMKKPNYNWSAPTANIIEEFNKGYGQVFYFAHGSNTSWLNPVLSTLNVSTLNNGSKLPVVFSMACETGNFSVNGCLCEKFLTASNGGAVGVIGFTNGTLIAYTDVIASALYNSMYPYPGIYPIIDDRLNESYLTPPHDNREFPVTELGMLHRLAITSLVNSFPSSTYSKAIQSYEAAMLTLFGDPSMHINLSLPTSVIPEVSINNGIYTVKAPGSDYIITVYNKNTKVVKNYKGSVTLSSPTIPSPYIISVHAPGVRPYIIDLSLQTPLKANRIDDENQVLKEGRLWRYNSYFNGKMSPSEDIYLNLGFSGSTEIDGMDYMNCYVWKDGDEFSEDKAALIAYMREEEGKVYVRYIPDAYATAMDKGIDIIPYAPMMAPYNHDLDALSKKDVLLFDNSLELGDLLWSLPDNTGDRFKVVKTEEIECFDITRTVWTLDKENGHPDWYNYYEGIGDDYGLLPFPNSWPITYDSYPWRLVEVIDQAGNVLFAPSQISTGINDPVDESKVVKESFHTVGGIEIDQPTTSGVYLKTQILQDGSRRTRKIIVK